MGNEEKGRKFDAEMRFDENDRARSRWQRGVGRVMEPEGCGSMSSVQPFSHCKYLHVLTACTDAPTISSSGNIERYCGVLSEFRILMLM